MDGLDVMFDGINVQHAGELLLDEPQSTRVLRGICPNSYLRSLEDFAFAAIFAGKIVTTRKLTNVLDGIPGEKLLTEYFADKHERRQTEAIASGWESLLDGPQDRFALRRLITSLGDVMKTDSGVFWKELVIREVVQYLGDHESLKKPCAGAEYRFVDRGNFRRDEELQNAVPSEYMRTILEEIRSRAGFHAGVKIAHDDALSEFASRNVLAHVGIYHWYCQLGEKAIGREKGARIPHATRHSFPGVEKTLWRMKDLVMPGLLKNMLEKSRSRDEVRDKLISASMDTTYQPVRDKLASAWSLLEKEGKGTELDSLVRDIERELEAWKHPETRHIVFSTKGSPYEQAVKMLVWRSGGPISAAAADCKKVFPELCDYNRSATIAAAAPTARVARKWDVFVCHASEDKEVFVRPLVVALKNSGLSVWYDEFALKVGDSLRRKIDEGLANSRYGIVVLSSYFFAKNWPQHELDGLMSREVSGIKVILPVWHDITFELVREKSPILSGLVAAKSSEGMHIVLRKLREAMGS